MNFYFPKLKFLKKFNFSTFRGCTTKVNFVGKVDSVGGFSEDVLLQIRALRLLYRLSATKVNILFLRVFFSRVLEFFRVLKSRVDYVLLSSKLFVTVNQIRQNISHKHIFVNNRNVKSGSYLVRKFDIIHVKHIPSKLLKDSLFYNYFMCSLDERFSNSRVYKFIKGSTIRRRMLVDFNFIAFNLTVCVKTFKVQINLHCDNSLLV